MTEKTDNKTLKDRFIIAGVIAGLILFVFLYIKLVGFTFAEISEFGEANNINWLTFKSPFYIFMCFILGGFSPLILVYIVVTIMNNTGYKKQLKKIKALFDKDKKEAVKLLSKVSKEQINNSNYDRFRKDLLPLIKKECEDRKNKKLLKQIEELFDKTSTYSTPYNPGSAMASPSDYLPLMEYKTEINELLDQL